MAQESLPIPFLRLAFRPMFLLGAVFSLLAIAVWTASLSGHLTLAPYGGSLFWHAHEMVFGFVMAVVVGFLLTAVQNWTGITGTRGHWLGLLVLVWLAGRMAMAFNLPIGITALVDCLFLPLAAWYLARPIVAVKQFRNLMFVPMLLVMTLGNGLSHWGAAYGDLAFALQGIYLAAWMVVLIMTVLGGRILPMFTANGSQTLRVENLPWLERGCIGITLALVLLQGSGVANQLPAGLNGGVALLAALLHAARLFRLRFRVTLGVPLLWSLHLAFWFLPLLFLLLAWHYLAPAGWLPISKSTAMHALFTGAMGNMILAMMARVSLGHTGRPLHAPAWMSLAFAATLVAAIARVLCLWLWPSHYLVWLSAAGFAWCLGYGIFCIGYFPLLTRARLDGKPG